MCSRPKKIGGDDVLFTQFDDLGEYVFPLGWCDYIHQLGYT